MALTESQAASGFLTAALQSQGKETAWGSQGHAQPPGTQPSRYASSVAGWTDASS